MRVLILVPEASSDGAAPRQLLRNAELSRSISAWQEAVNAAFASVRVVTADALAADGVADAQCVLLLGMNPWAACISRLPDTVHSVFVWPVGLERDFIDAFAAGTLSSPPCTVSEGWVHPQSLAQARMVAHALSEAELRVVPQLWTPSPLARTLGLADATDAVYDAPSRTCADGIDVVIVSDLASSTADVLTPLLICMGMPPAMLRSVIIMCAEPLPAATQSYINTHISIADKVRYVRATCDEVVPFFLKRAQYSVFLYHQRDRTEFPTLLWDLCYIGVPVIHNLQTTMRIGLRYRDTDIALAVKLLTLKHTSLGREYMQQNRAALEVLTPAKAVSALKALAARVSAKGSEKTEE